MSLILVITDAGRAALVNARNDGTNAVRVASVGVSSTAVVPAKAATALPGEVKRIATISGDQVAADVIHLSVQDESADTYSLRSFALYLADGTLFAIYGQPAPIVEKSAQALLLLALDVTLADLAANTITFGNANFINPPATTERRGVVELATDEEAAALVDATRALTPRSIKVIFTKANIVDRLGFTPINPEPSTLVDQWYRTGRFRFTSTRNTGARDGTLAGSLVVSSDGQESSGATMTFHRFGSFAVNMGLDRDNVFRIGGASANANLLAITDLGECSIAGSRAWHAGNDGAGSGLDADLLDGRNLGTSGDAIPSLAGTNVWAGRQTFSQSVRVASVTAIGSEVGGYELYSSDPNNGWYAGMRAFVPLGSEGVDYVDLRFFTTLGKAGERMRITPTGAVGIGTGTPAYKLHVAGSVGIDADLTVAGIARSVTYSSPGAQVGGYEIYNYGVANNWFAGMRAFVPVGAEGVNFLDLRFFTCSGAPAERMRINAGGNVGIGTTDPNYRLHVAGSGCFDALYRSGFSVWDSANDGAGSGLDADLLDGRQGAEFALLTGADFAGVVSAQTPAAGTTGGLRLRGNAASGRAHFQVTDATMTAQWGYLAFTAAGSFLWNENPVWHAGNDGAGSGLDADLLDGRQGAEFALLTGANFTGPVTAGGATIWTSANDGAGSGLDADLLDGRDSSYFAPTEAPSFIGDVRCGNNIRMTNAAPQILMGSKRIGLGLAGALCLYNDGTGNERLRLSDDGRVSVLGPRNAVGDVQGSGSLRVIAHAEGGYAISTNDSADYTAVQFTRSTGQSVAQIGSITCGETSTSYNTASDYRLKENAAPLTGALDRLLALPALRFNFKSSPATRVDGFLAHEVAVVVPEAVHGAKDAVDADGAPVFQQIDQSKLVPLLVAAVQELAAEVAALRAAA